MFSRFKWIWSDDARYNIRESEGKKSLVKVQISYCREKLYSVKYLQLKRAIEEKKYFSLPFDFG